MTTKVFVYGTLKPGHVNYRRFFLSVFQTADHIGEGVTKDRYPLLVPRRDPLPRLLDCPGQGHQVQGFLFNLADPVQLELLDLLEGHPHWYERKLTSVLVDNTEHEAWIYFYHLSRRELTKKERAPDQYQVSY